MTSNNMPSASIPSKKSFAEVQPAVDWKALAENFEQLGPISSAPDHKRFYDFMQAFPPVAVLVQRDFVSGPSKAEVEGLIVKLMNECVAAGQGHLLAVTGVSNAPVRMMAAENFPKAMSICLEQGADPTARPSAKYMSTEQLALTGKETGDVMRAHMSTEGKVSAANLAKDAVVHQTLKQTVSHEFLGKMGSLAKPPSGPSKSLRP